MIKNDSLFSGEAMTRSDRCIHTPGNFAKQNLLYVQEVGRLKSLQPHKCIRENLDSYLFLIVLSGKGTLKIKNVEYRMEKGGCALVNCMEYYEHISDDQDAWELAWVHFNGHSAKGYYDLFKKYNGESNVFSVQETAAWDECLGEILRIQKERNFHGELKSGELLIGLLNRVLENVANSEAAEREQEKQFVNELREKLNEYYADFDVLNRMEQFFGDMMERLGGVFEQQYGISVEEYISNRRLNAAKEMLRFSIKPIEEVAKECGIEDLDQMQKMFRENEGMSAEEYRMKWAQWIR